MALVLNGIFLVCCQSFSPLVFVRVPLLFLACSLGPSCDSMVSITLMGFICALLHVLYFYSTQHLWCLGITFQCFCSSFPYYFFIFVCSRCYFLCTGSFFTESVQQVLGLGLGLEGGACG